MGVPVQNALAVQWLQDAGVGCDQPAGQLWTLAAAAAGQCKKAWSAGRQ